MFQIFSIKLLFLGQTGDPSYLLLQTKFCLTTIAAGMSNFKTEREHKINEEKLMHIHNFAFVALTIFSIKLFFLG